MSAKKPVRLGDVCKMLDLQPYVLRYWETEFPALRAAEGGSASNRAYGEGDVRLLRRIKTLLYEEGYTIAGAKKKLESEPDGGRGETARQGAPLFDELESAEDGNGEGEAVPAFLDTANGEQVETLRRGVAAALEEARQILAILDPSQDSGE